MPIELFYGDRSYQVAPISADADTIVLEIDGQPIAVSRSDLEQAQDHRFIEPVSQTPTDADLFTMFLPAAANQFVGPRLKFEDDPNAQELIAQQIKISGEELEQWHVLFTQI